MMTRYRPRLIYGEDRSLLIHLKMCNVQFLLEFKYSIAAILGMATSQKCVQMRDNRRTIKG